MGLQGQLNDVSDSIPLLFIAIIAGFIGHLRSLLSTLLHPARRLPQSDAADGGDPYPSGFSTLIALAEQLNLNRALSHRFNPAHAAADCVVCLSSLRDGEQVRRLPCRHVFHKGCFDGWLDQLNFSCPLCRSPLVSDARAASAGRRVGRDFVAWFALR